MRSFLDQAAEALWLKYGDEIATLKLVFPSRRARLFFGEALSKYLEKPLWQPEYLSMDEFIWRFSNLQPVDNLRLVAELYKVYSDYHDESFDKFYGWGVTLLHDFDLIDKYMVDARKLFINIGKLSDIERFFDSNSEELKIVKSFWRNFSEKKQFSNEESEFLTIWQSLESVYSKYKDNLINLGIAYPGLAYSIVAEDISEIFKSSNTYVFIGFNALNTCEYRILKYLQEKSGALFLWDYSTFYTDNPKQEAGRFIRKNLNEFPPVIELDSSFNEGLQLSVISCPTDILQCKTLTSELEKVFDRQGFIDKETAIVLTDEKILPQVLNSIPDIVEKLNITMGYPVVNTLIYNLIDRLLQLQLHKKNDRYYYLDVLGILEHPYIIDLNPSVIKKYILQLSKEQEVYVEYSRFGDMEYVFEPVYETDHLQKYLLKILSYLSDTKDVERREFAYTLISSISKLENTINNCEISLTLPVYISILRQTLSQVRIPYTGEPLGGLQIMGILETRNLDFTNVIMLSVNDDNFPGNHLVQSAIPYNLRQAYGMPISVDSEAMYAYYFYRLMQKADNMVLMYTSAADDKTTGEQSRYIYQLEYESDIVIERSVVTLSASQSIQDEFLVNKSDAIMSKLHNKRFSPSSINRYLSCPMKFYFNDISRITSPETLDEEFSKLNFGNVFHKAMELLYLPLIGIPNPQEIIKKITDVDIENAITDALKANNLMIYTGNISQFEIIKSILKRYVKQNLIYDLERADNYVIDRLEYKILAELFGVKFVGSADRIDRLEDGSIAIIDYKTGSDINSFSSIDELFNSQKENRNNAALQTLIYGLMFFQSEHVDVSPRLYSCKYMNRDDFSPFLSLKSKEIRLVDNDLMSDVGENLAKLISEIFNADFPFTQNRVGRNCEFCDYNHLCNN